MKEQLMDEKEFKDKELEVIEPLNPVIAGVDFSKEISFIESKTPMFTSPEPETEVLDGRGMIYEILDEE